MIDPDVEQAARDLAREGAAAHPEIALDAGTFARFVLARAATRAEIAALVGPDLYLACACAEGDARALSIFEARCLALVPAFLARQRLPPDVVDEVKQRTRERLFVRQGDRAPKIAEYAGRGALEAWLRVLVVRVSANLRRQIRPHDDLDEIIQVAAVGSSPEVQLLRARTNQAFAAALRDAFVALAPEDRALFRLQFGKGLTLDAMATVLGIHRATAARRIAAARRELFTRVLALLTERLGEGRMEIERALGEWQSKMDISLNGLLRATNEGG